MRKLIFKSFLSGERLAEYVNENKIVPTDIERIFLDEKKGLYSIYSIFYWKDSEEVNKNED